MEQASFPLPEETVDELDRIGLEFLADFLGEETRRRPHNLDALVELAHVLTRLERHAEGLVIDMRLAEQMPSDATVRYNLACSLALTGASDRALEELNTAVKLGYQDPEHLALDEDLGSLRPDPRFQALLRELRAASPESRPD